MNQLKIKKKGKITIKMYLPLLVFYAKIFSVLRKQLRSAYKMPNIKSAKKRVLVNKRQKAENRLIIILK